MVQRCAGGLSSPRSAATPTPRRAATPPADIYWGKTKDYWAAVQVAWDAAAKRYASLAVREEAQNGSMTGPRLMGLVDEIAEGKTTTDAAIVEPRAVIARETGAP